MLRVWTKCPHSECHGVRAVDFCWFLWDFNTKEWWGGDFKESVWLKILYFCLPTLEITVLNNLLRIGINRCHKSPRKSRGGWIAATLTLKLQCMCRFLHSHRLWSVMWIVTTRHQSCQLGHRAYPSVKMVNCVKIHKNAKLCQHFNLFGSFLCGDVQWVPK